MYIDAHCHMDLPVFQDDLALVLARAADRGITGFIVAGIEQRGWARQRHLSRQYPRLAWTAGLHPVAAAKLTEIDAMVELDGLDACFEGDNCAIGVGEIGLDRVFARPETLDVQMTVFRAQLDFARRRNMPIVLHAVGCHGAVLDVLRSDGVPSAGGMVHSFGGAPGLAQAYLSLGLHISVSGLALNPNAHRLQQTIAQVPKDRLLLESDAPDQGLTKGARNEPIILEELGKHIAEIRGCKASDILRDSARNCIKLFGQKALGWALEHEV
jgi:TatD DNase family protein